MATFQDRLRTDLSKQVELAQWAKAVQTLEGLVKFEPTKTQYYLRMGDYSLKAGNKANAITYYYQAADRYVQDGFSAKAMAIYKMILRIEPEESQAWDLIRAVKSESVSDVSTKLPETNKLSESNGSTAHEPNAAVVKITTKKDVRERLKRAVILQRKKSKQLTATKAQLVLYAKDLKRSVGSEQKRTQELTAAHQQMLKYVSDLKESLKISRRQARELNEAYRSTIIALSRAIEARDRYTAYHTDRVTAYGMEIAKYIGWRKEKLSILEMGGHIHDVGKLAILDSILNKPGRLTEEEFEVMRSHPVRGAEIVEGIQFLKPMIPYILYHHERFDGTGYPAGLKGDAIPEEGRLLAVADTFDAMTSSRSYRPALPVEKALDELKNGAGTQFDPDFVEAFLEVWKTGRMEPIVALGRDGKANRFRLSVLGDGS